MDNLLPKFNNKMVLSYPNAITGDIIDSLNSCFVQAKKDTKQWSDQFRGSTMYESAYNIWKYVRNNVLYKKDPDGLQVIQLPNAVIHRKHLGSDCKSRSLLISAVLSNLGADNVRFRYASYKNDWIPTHVYTIFTFQGRDVPVDSVITTFDFEKPFSHKIDHKMNVYQLSGIEELSEKKLNDLHDKMKDGSLCKHLIYKEIKRKRGDKMDSLTLNPIQSNYYEKKLRAHIKMHTNHRKFNLCYDLKVKELNDLLSNNLQGSIGSVADEINGIGKLSLKKVFKGVKKFGLAPNRNAFLLLVKENILNLASRLKHSDQGKVKKMWEKLGGNFSKLQKNIEHGYYHGLGSKKHKQEIKGIGVADPATATIIASASTVLVAFIGILAGSKHPKKDKDGKEMKNPDGSPVMTSGSGVVDELEKAGIKIPDAIEKIEQVFHVGPKGEILDKKDDVEIVDKEKSGFSLSPKILMIAGAGALGLVLLLKKKK